MIIETSGRAKHYALFLATELITSDVLRDGDHLATSLDCIVDEDENEWLRELPAESLPPVPPQGTWLEADVLYRDGDRAVMVRLAHFRTEHDIDDLIPHLFLAYREGAEGLEWIYGEDVSVGMHRWYDGIEYRCDIAHVTEYPPPQAPALWTEVVEEGDPWQSGITYDLGAVVTHNNATWESRRANNVWEPGTNDSGWLRIEPYPSDWYYLGGEGYPLDWEVHHNGYLWRNTVAGNHWTPGVYGWTQVEPL